MVKLLLSYLTGALLSGLISVASTFLLTRLLSPAAYGEGMLFISILNCLFFLCNLGMDQVFVRHFYEPNYQNKLSVLLYRCLAIIFFNTILVFLVLTGFEKSIFTMFHIHQSTSWLYILPVGTVLFVLLRFSQLIPRLLENPKHYSIANVLKESIFLIAVLLFIYNGRKNANDIIYSYLLAITVVLLWLVFIYRQHWNLLSISYRELFTQAEIKNFLRYGSPFIFSLSLTWIFNNVDKFMLLKWSNLHELGIYTAAFALASPLVMLQSVFTTTWAPKLNQLIISDSQDSKAILSKTFRNTCWALTLGALLLVLLKPILVLFLGEKFRAAGQIFTWLLFMPYFYALSEITVAGIVKSKKSYWNVPISLICLSTNLLGCYFSIPRFGAEGAAISIAASFAVFFVMRTVIAFRYYTFSLNYFEYGILIGFLIYVINVHTNL